MFEGLLLVLPLLMPARAPPKCGCCGEAGHNRRNCPHLARIREQQGNDHSTNDNTTDSNTNGNGSTAGLGATRRAG